MFRESPAPSAADACSIAGRILAARYRIERPLLRYRSANVYRAQDTLLHESVAIKAVPAASSDDQRVQRLRAEARVARRITHPNVLRVHDVGVCDRAGEGTLPVYFLSMRLVHGLPLSRLLASGPLEASVALELARQLSSALVAAHGANAAHGHLTADQVIVEGAASSLRCVLTGFGEHEPCDDGVPPPACPESAGALGRQRDLHDFGTLLFEMAAARPDRSPVVDPPLSTIAERCRDTSAQHFVDAAQLHQALADAGTVPA